MDWMEWVLLILGVLAGGGITFLLLKGHISADKATASITTIVQMILEAERKWKEYKAAGPQKKAWVMGQLRALGVKCNNAVLGTLIDAIVSWLNTVGWDTEKV